MKSIIAVYAKSCIELPNLFESCGHADSIHWRNTVDPNLDVVEAILRQQRFGFKPNGSNVHLKLPENGSFSDFLDLVHSNKIHQP